MPVVGYEYEVLIPVRYTPTRHVPHLNTHTHTHKYTYSFHTLGNEQSSCIARVGACAQENALCAGQHGCVAVKLPAEQAVQYGLRCGQSTGCKARAGPTVQTYRFQGCLAEQTAPKHEVLPRASVQVGASRVEARVVHEHIVDPVHICVEETDSLCTAQPHAHVHSRVLMLARLASARPHMSKVQRAKLSKLCNPAADA